MTGNEAVAAGVKLSNVKVIAAYPITPQTTIVEKLAEMVANGELNSKFIEVESEHSAMSAVTASEMDVRILIDEIVKNMGYRTYPGYPEDYIWVDHGDGSGEVIMLLENDDMEKIREYNSSTVSFPGERFLFLLFDGPNKEILSYCKGHKITPVTRNEAAKMLGMTLIDMHLAKKTAKSQRSSR
jgi:ketoisovalerate ferredoxin oxidoreductase, alpha subunit (EC 1.2.7.7)